LGSLSRDRNRPFLMTFTTSPYVIYLVLVCAARIETIDATMLMTGLLSDEETHVSSFGLLPGEAAT